jgi:uncharacterized zinc-type alcohol dehydrogenase-like protein
VTATIKAYAATEAGAPLAPFEYNTGPLGPEEVEIKVESCGICHSDLSVLDNQWGMSQYPLVAGHEVVGEVAALGERVGHLAPGRKVGLGWFSRSCMHCETCLRGDHNLCGEAEQTIIGRHGGFADRVRCHWSWATPLPDGLDRESAGPLFCGGITVFNPIVQAGVSPTDRVGVVGIGGLGHLALQFLGKWGCEVTAFTSSEDKAEAARGFGAHHVVSSRDDDALDAAAGTLDFLLVTVNAPLSWDRYLNALKPRGRLHLVGAVLEPIPVPAFALIPRQRSVSGSPLGSPALNMAMLDFCNRHDIRPQIETFPMSKVNDALEHLRAGKARFRIVLKNDF